MCVNISYVVLLYVQIGNDAR